MVPGSAVHGHLTLYIWVEHPGGGNKQCTGELLLSWQVSKQREEEPTCTSGLHFLVLFFLALELLGWYHSYSGHVFPSQYFFSRNALTETSRSVPLYHLDDSKSSPVEKS